MKLWQCEGDTHFGYKYGYGNDFLTSIAGRILNNKKAFLMIL